MEAPNVDTDREKSREEKRARLSELMEERKGNLKAFQADVAKVKEYDALLNDTRTLETPEKVEETPVEKKDEAEKKEESAAPPVEDWKKKYEEQNSRAEETRRRAAETEQEAEDLRRQLAETQAALEEKSKAPPEPEKELPDPPEAPDPDDLEKYPNNEDGLNEDYLRDMRAYNKVQAAYLKEVSKELKEARKQLKEVRTKADTAASYTETAREREARRVEEDRNRAVDEVTSKIATTYGFKTGTPLSKHNTICFEWLKAKKANDQVNTKKWLDKYFAIPEADRNACQSINEAKTLYDNLKQIEPELTPEDPIFKGHLAKKKLIVLTEPIDFDTLKHHTPTGRPGMDPSLSGSERSEPQSIEQKRQRFEELVELRRDNIKAFEKNTAYKEEYAELKRTLYG